MNDRVQIRVACPHQHATVTAMVAGRRIFRIGQKNTRISDESAITKVRNALKMVPTTKEAQEALSALASTTIQRRT